MYLSDALQNYIIIYSEHNLTRLTRTSELTFLSAVFVRFSQVRGEDSNNIIPM